ncbi:hypothetical protein EE612_031946 [Oryza sativa]|nr:hypothetical protein EE612_031946 [Oryza sativa]
MSNIKIEHTVSSSMSSSSSGTCGGLKKLKKLSQTSVLVIGFAFFEPFLGFFFRIFCVRFLPGYHSISVPIAFSKIGSSSSTMWYVFVRTEFLKKGFVSKKKSSLKPLGSSILAHLISFRYFKAGSSRSWISSESTSFVFIAVSQKSGTPLASASLPSAAFSLAGSSFPPSTSTTPFTMLYLCVQGFIKLLVLRFKRSSLFKEF